MESEWCRAETAHIGFVSETQLGQHGDMLDPGLLCLWSGASQKGSNPPLPLLFFHREKDYLSAK